MGWDLYASGGEVRIDGTVAGDLIGAAGQVTITGVVEGDVMASGGRIEIPSEVVGDVRAAGGQLTLRGSIGEDLFVAGGQVTVSETGEVGEDLVFGAGQTTLAGAVVEDVLGRAGNYERTGTVGGSENVTIAQAEEPTLADRSLTALQRFVSILLLGTLVLWLVPRLINGPTETQKLPRAFSAISGSSRSMSLGISSLARVRCSANRVSRPCCPPVLDRANQAARSDRIRAVPLGL